MTKQEQIADFLNKWIAFPRVASRYAGWDGLQPWPSYYGRPTAEQVAGELLGIVEFQALELGSWLGTTDGRVITEAVEMVMPPFFRADVALLVEALKLAASLQQQKGQQVAGAVALGALAVGLIVIGVAASGTGKAA
jgi:hypothetical protein